MSDEKFLQLKKEILEVGNECRELNKEFATILKEIGTLDDKFTKLQYSIYQLKCKVGYNEFKK